MIVIIIGRRGYGKTTYGLYLLKKIKNYARRSSCYVISPNPIPHKLSCEVLEDIDKIENIKNSSILVDDATVYLYGSMFGKNIRDAVVSARHRNLDIIFVFHNVSQTPPILFSLADAVVFFSITDKISGIKDKLSFNPKLYKAALSAINLKKYENIIFNLNTNESIFSK